MIKKKITNILLFVSLAILLFGSGVKLGEYKVNATKIESPNFNILNGNPANQQAKNVDFGIFWDTWNQLEQKYVDKSKLNPQKMVYGATKGLVASLGDPYTFFMTPEENNQSKQDLGGNFDGIGAQLGLKNNKIVIIAPLKGSPAAKAGVKAGDSILKVDGKSTADWTLTQAVAKIRGKKGTKVTLTLGRGNQQLDVTIVRDVIHVNSIDLSYETTYGCTSNCKQVALVKINQFGEDTNAEWDKTMADVVPKWQKKEIKGLVIDVRDNPGGYLDSAVYIASEFLHQGQLIVKQESTTTENHNYLALRNGQLQDIPIVILINKGSASAAEILAGALSDNKRAVLIGETSFGKGSVQEALDLQNGAGLHVTVAKWILPDGVWINGKGITPDVKVDNQIPKGNTLTREEDKQLETAIERLVK